MHHRFLSWMCFCALAAVTPFHAQPLTTAAGAPVGMPPGMVLVAKVSGTVTMLYQGVQTAVNVDDRIPQAATVITGQEAESSVVLVFSNGATTQLGMDTELIIQEFLQDPFASTIRVAELAEEPSASRTNLRLNRGELVGNVKRLQHSRGSSFTVHTPVGAAGIRGTTFRIVFRPSGTGQAFFQLSTAEGNIAFSQGVGTDPGVGGGVQVGGADGAPAGQPGEPQAGDAQPAGTTPTAPAAAGASGVADIPVPQGQEITVTVTVTTNQQGQVVAAVAPTVTSTAPISPTTMALVTQAAQQIAVATQQATFTSPAPASTGGATTTGEGSTGTTTSGSTTGGTTGSTGGGTTDSPPGGTTGSTTGSSGGDTSGGTPPSGSAPAASPAPNPPPTTNPPPPTTQPPRVTVGDGG
jgi:hypothetical protein